MRRTRYIYIYIYYLFLLFHRRCPPSPSRLPSRQTAAQLDRCGSRRGRVQRATGERFLPCLPGPTSMRECEGNDIAIISVWWRSTPKSHRPKPGLVDASIEDQGLPLPWLRRGFVNTSACLPRHPNFRSSEFPEGRGDTSRPFLHRLKVEEGTDKENRR